MPNALLPAVVALKRSIAIFSALGLTIAASTTGASATTLSDGTFNNVTLTSVFNSDPTGTTLTTMTPCPSCGNPGAGIQAFFDFTHSSLPGGTLISVDVGFIDNALSYNPTTQGAISSITASADKMLSTTVGNNPSGGTGGNSFRPMIVQGGNFYLAAISGPGVPEPGTTGWNTLFQAGLTASAFLQYDFSTGTFGTANPDFAGGPMLFGLGQLSGFFPGYTATADYDNLSFTLVPTPLPATLPLFATGLGALGLLGWRRKRKAAHAA